MQLGEMKPIVTALVMPPAGPVLLALLGLVWMRFRRGAGMVIAVFGLVLLLALSSNGVAVQLARWLTPPFPVAQPAQVQRTQAIVVLGGGVLPHAPEYGVPQPSASTVARVRYGVWLARKTGVPLAFTGGTGWGASTESLPEAAVAKSFLQDDYGLAFRWLDDRARDTGENATRMAQILHPQGIKKITLVTDAVHMPRAVVHFRKAGFDVLPAPTDLPAPQGSVLVEWLPSANGLMHSRHVLREWLGRMMASVA